MEPLYESNPEHKALYFERSHQLHIPIHVPGAQDRHLVALTGAVKHEFKGISSEEWTEEILRLRLNFPDIIPAGKWLKLETWAPFVTISGIDKGSANHNGGWMIKDFWVDEDYDPIKPYQDQGRRIILLGIGATVTVRGSLFSIYRVGYSVTVSGVLIDAHPSDPDSP